MGTSSNSNNFTKKHPEFMNLLREQPYRKHKQNGYIRLPAYNVSNWISIVNDMEESDVVHREVFEGTKQNQSNNDTQ